jgi:malate dehydrogenase
MSAMRRNVAVVGDGAAGALTAWSLGRRATLRVTLLAPCEATPPGVHSASGWDELAGSDVVVLAADDPSRDVLEPLARDLAARAPDAIAVVAGHGDRATCAGLLAATGFPRGRVLGVGGMPASTALRASLARGLGADPAGMTGLVLGGGGAAAVPIRSTFTLAGAPVDPEVLERALARAVPAAGAYALATAAEEVVECVAFDARRLLPCAVRCEGEYGIAGAVVSVPVLVGADGNEGIVQIALTDGEREGLRRAAAPSATTATA